MSSELLENRKRLFKPDSGKAWKFMKRKYLPLILMLTAGVVTGIFTCINGYSIVAKLVSLLIVLIVFYIIGLTVKGLLDLFDRQNEERAKKAETEETKEEK